MRNDEVWKQPNLMKAARSAAAQVESEAIRAAILDELRRIPAAGSSSRFVREVHAAFLQDMEKGFPNPSGNPSANPSGNPGGTAEGDVSPGQEDAGNPSPNPSAEAKPNPPGNRSPKASANPSQERGEGYGVNQGEPLSPELLPTGDAGKGSPKGSANPSTAQELVADWLEHCRKRPPDRVVGQVAKELGILLDEGQDPADIRRGLAAWHLAAKHPSTLASFVNEVMNGSSARGRPGSAGRLQRGGASDELAHEEYGKGKTRI
jgi:hypothetical protein